MLTRTEKYMKHTSSRFRKFAQGLLSEETIDLMESGTKQPLTNTAELDEDELEEVLARYTEPSEIRADKESEIAPAELTARKALSFSPDVYARAKACAKDEGETLSSFVNNAVNRAVSSKEFYKEIDAELQSVKATSGKYEGEL